MIYWVRSGDIGPVKVGYAATDVPARIKMLQCGSPLPLVLLRAEPGERDIELALHDYYRDKHVRGEWFMLTGDDVQVDLSLVERRAKRIAARQNRIDTDVSVFIRRMGGRKVIAEVLAIPKNTIVYWELRNSIPSANWPALIGHAASIGCVVTLDDMLALAPPKSPVRLRRTTPREAAP